jgi:hypothetical protein
MARHLHSLAFCAHAALSALAVLLCVVAILFGALDRTEGRTIILSHANAGAPRTFRFIQLWSCAGGIRLMLGVDVEQQPFPNSQSGWQFLGSRYSPGSRPYPFDTFGGPDTRAWTLGSFEFYRKDYAIPTYSERNRSITAPAWCFAALFAVPPLLWLRALRRRLVARRRLRLGLCVHCGYDVRSSPERCPECGASRS